MTASTRIEMIGLPPGRVTLSDRRTGRVWSVELAPYQLGPFPVTQAQYSAVTGQRPDTAGADRLPVEDVSWWDAVRFCNSYRVLRGGWFDEQWSCRASVRRCSHPTLRIDDVGFRVARSMA